MTLDELREKAPRLAMCLAVRAASDRDVVLAELDTLLREARAAECEALCGALQLSVAQLDELYDRAASIRRGELDPEPVKAGEG